MATHGNARRSEAMFSSAVSLLLSCTVVGVAPLLHRSEYMVCHLHMAPSTIETATRTILRERFGHGEELT